MTTRKRSHPDHCSCATRGEQCEEAFALQIQELAERQGWLCHRMPTWRPTCSSPGFPDLTLVGHGRLIHAELKTDKGWLTKVQVEWHFALLEAPGETYIWRPGDWVEIEDRLRRPETPKRLAPRPFDERPEGVKG